MFSVSFVLLKTAVEFYLFSSWCIVQKLVRSRLISSRIDRLSLRTVGEILSILFPDCRGGAIILGNKQNFGHVIKTDHFTVYCFVEVFNQSNGSEIPCKYVAISPSKTGKKQLLPNSRYPTLIMGRSLCVCPYDLSSV